jgi:hypothetical protein
MKKITLKLIMLFTIALSFTTISCSNDDSTDQNQLTAKSNDLGSSKTAVAKAIGPNLPDLYEVKKYVFVRKNGANGLGHVGVAFELRARISGVNYTSFYCGGVEGTNGWFGIPNAFTPAGGDNGGWQKQVSTQAQMFAQFGAKGYNGYKFSQNFLIVTLARSNAGKAIISGFPGRGYNVSGNNCMNAVYDLLSNFSFPGDAGNPAVPSSYAPNSWYASLTVNGGWSNPVILQ